MSKLMVYIINIIITSC